MAKKLKKKDSVLISLNISVEQKEWLDEMGGVTEGIRKIFGFWYENFEIWETQEKQRVSIKRKLEAVYKK